MARSIWKGAITFGLVNIPVEIVSAEERREFKFSMLDKRDFSPVGYKRYSKESGKEVAWNDIVKGYEYEKGQYVVLSDEDFKRANVKASRTIDIESFVPAKDVSPQYFESPYYLVPGDRGEKVYSLLRETLRSTGRIAIAQFVLRTTPHLVAVQPVGRALMLLTLRYADELKESKGLELPAEGLKEVRVTSKEIDLAKQLIEGMSDKWNPAQYKNTYHEDLMHRIEEKIKSGETHELTAPSDETAPPRTAQVIDLAALLKKSIATGGAPRRAGAHPRTKEESAPLRAVASSRPARQTAKRKRA
ncbi:MAG: Ku protein [Betaproteobacteria bacterium]|nr:Ku protein [Betaproteobacteria bacterium]